MYSAPNNGEVNNIEARREEGCEQYEKYGKYETDRKQGEKKRYVASLRGFGWLIRVF